MTIERDRAQKHSFISQQGCIEDLLIKYGKEELKTVENPCAYDFMEDGDSFAEYLETSFLSLCMSLMFVPRMTRQDILFAGSSLATKVVIRLKNIFRNLGGCCLILKQPQIRRWP